MKDFRRFYFYKMFEGEIKKQIIYWDKEENSEYMMDSGGFCG